MESRAARWPSPFFARSPNRQSSNVAAFQEPSRRAHRAQPFQGCGRSTPQSQGSLASSATLGFEAESLRDSEFEEVHGRNACAKRMEAVREPAVGFLRLPPKIWQLLQSASASRTGRS